MRALFRSTLIVTIEHVLKVENNQNDVATWQDVSMEAYCWVFLTSLPKVDLVF